MSDTTKPPPILAQWPRRAEPDRRKFIQAVGILAGTAAATGLSSPPAFAQNIQPASRKPMANQTKIIDFHCHHIPARFELTAARYAPASQRARWESLARALSDEDLLLKDVRDGELDARVVSILIQLIADAEGRVPRDTVMAMNDALAGLVARHPGRIHGWRRSMPMTATVPLARPNAPSGNLGCVVCCSNARAVTCCSTHHRRALRWKSPQNLAYRSLRIP